MEVKTFFENNSCTFTYLVYDPFTKDAVIIDPVLNYDLELDRNFRIQFQQIVDFVSLNHLKPLGVLETHLHADHLSSASCFKAKYESLKVYISENIISMQKFFKESLGLKELNTDGSNFDHLFKDQEVLHFGSLSFKVIATPGHTPTCSSFYSPGHLFVGDAIFMPDFGTGRCDFPNGSPDELFKSIMNIYQLDGFTNVYIGHDYPTNKRSREFKTTIDDLKEKNIHINRLTKKEDFIAFRNKRDASLLPPKLLDKAIPFNLSNGNV